MVNGEDDATGPADDPEFVGGRPRAAVVDATIRLLDERGYRRLSLAAIAARSGVEETALRHRWSTPSHVVAEILAGHLIFEPLEVTGDAAADVRALLQRAVRLYSTPPLSTIMPEIVAGLADDPDRPGDPPDRLLEVLRGARAAHRDFLDRVAATLPGGTGLNVDLVLDVVGGTLLYRRLFGRPPSSTLADQLTDLVVDRALPRIDPRREL